MSGKRRGLGYKEGKGKGGASATSSTLPAASSNSSSERRQHPQPSAADERVEMQTDAAAEEDAHMNDDENPAEGAPSSAGVASDDSSSAEANFLHQYSQYLARQEGATFNFEQFTQLIATIRSIILSGESSISLPAADEEDTSSTPAAAPATEAGIELRSLLHEIRVAFAAEYPLSPTSWLEWIDDVQTIGTGLPPAAGGGSAEESSHMADEEDDDGAAAEAAEARASAAARDEQHFLLSLYRMALADYFSPAIWTSFLSYVSLTSETLLASKAARIAFRRVYSQALFPRGWKVEQKRRLAERREKKRAKKAAEKEKKKQAEANAAVPKSKKQRAAVDDEEEDEDAEAESDEDDDEDMSDGDDDTVDQSAVEASSFNLLHPALHPLLPPFAASTASLSAAIPIANSPDDGYALFQKLHEIEMKILTRMMRTLQKQQKQQQFADEESVTSEEVEEQVDRMSELYRTQLSIPMKDLQYAHQNFKDWQAKQGENAIETDVVSTYEHANKTQQLLEDKFEKHWAALVANNTFQAAVGTLTPEADQLLKAYVSFLSTGAFKKSLIKDPRLLFSVFERVLSIAFLDVSWWKQYLQSIATYGGIHSECMRLRLEVAWRAFRNCPWDAEIVSQLLQVSEELQIESADITNVLLTAEIVEGVIRRVLINPALQANVEANIEVQLQVIDYYRRTVLEKGTANQVDADIVRGYFMSIEHLLLYATTAPASLPARVFAFWADIEARFLWQFIEDASQMSDEASANAMGQLQQEALAQGVGVSHQAARAIYKRFTNSYGVGESGSPQSWMEWITFELAQFRAALYSSTSSSTSSSAVYSLSQLSTFVHDKFSEAFDQLTDSRFFTAADPDPATGTVSSSALTILTPLQSLCEKWLQFERTYSSLTQLQAAQKRVGKITLAFQQAKAGETLLAQQTAWQQQQQQQQVPIASAETEEEEESRNWLSKPKEKAKPAAPGKAKKGGKEKTVESKPKLEAEPSATTAPSDASAASDKGDSKKKRKREGEDEQQPAKKGKSKENEPSAAAPAAVQAPAEQTLAAVEEVVPPHTVFAVNIPWNLAEKDQRALLAPYGEITRLISHRASKTVKLGYVEITYDKEEACTNAAKALEGKELSGKKLHLFREKPTEELVKKATAGSTPAAITVAATTATGSNNPDVDPKSVFVKNLPRERDDIESLVRKFFEDKLGADSVASIELVRNDTVADDAPVHERFRNFGTVRFVSPEFTPIALSMHMSSLLDSLVQIVPDTTPARLKKEELAKKKQQEAQRKMQPVPRAALTAFQPRATAVKAAPNPAASAAASPAAATGTISSNEDFRARLFGKK